jgi:hypothetical protein
MALISFSCQSNSQEKWTKEMELSAYHGGGMRPESKKVFINDSICSYIHWNMPANDTFSFRLSKKELDDLLKEINKIRFTRIISGQTSSVIYDKPTTSVTFKWSGKKHEVSDGASQRIIKGNAAGFFTLCNYILSLAEKKSAPLF